MEKGNVDMELIRRYIRGELTPREMYTLERQAQADPMLMDIILGMEQGALGAHDDNLADIRKRITERAGRRRADTRRFAPFHRWAVAASILAVLTVGTWWFAREDTVQQHETTVAATPKEITDAEAESSQEPIPPANESEADAAPPQAARIASTDVATATEKQEKKEERLAMVTPKAGADADLLDSVVVVGYGTQEKAAVTGAVARIAAVEMDSPVIVKEDALAGRTDDIRIRGISAQKQAFLPLVTGKVIDEETQEPIAGVALQTVEGQRATTDAFGRFTLEDASDTLILNYIGYEQQKVDIAGRDTLTIALKPADVDLSEVVVVGYGTDKRQSHTVTASHPNISKPQPKNGWNAYRRYLKNAVKLAPGKRGTVDLTFTVDENGRPTDLKIIETSNVELNKFATLIVRDGPRWLPGANDERQVTLRVEFK